MPSFVDTLALYDLPGDEVVTRTAEFSRTQFNEAGTPVLICAYNEEEDLPVTLAALSRSDTAVQPYVVDNGSTDRTAEFGEAMGAIILAEQRPAKIFAVASGLEFIVRNRVAPQVLFTDADIVMTRQWTGNLLGHLVDAGEFSAVSGSAISHRLGEQRPQFMASSVRTVANVGKFYLDSIRNRPAKGRGHNMGFAFDSPDRALDIVEALDFTSPVTDDTQVMQGAISRGAASARATEISSIVLSRGDRMPNLLAVLRAFSNPDYRRRVLYSEWFERLDDNSDTVPVNAV